MIYSLIVVNILKYCDKLVIIFVEEDVWFYCLFYGGI